MSTLVVNKPNSYKENEDTIPHMNQLFKPLVVNQRIVRRSESDITTTSTTLPLSSINNDSNIPLIYPQFQLGVMPPMKNKIQMHPAYIFQQQENSKKIIDMKNKPCCSCNKTKCIKNIANVSRIINYAQIVYVWIVIIKIYSWVHLVMITSKKINQKK